MSRGAAAAPLLPTLLLGSAALFAALIIFMAIRTRRPRNIVLTVGALAAALALVYAASPGSSTTRGEEDGDVATLVLSYFSMVLGMMACYVYAQAEKDQKRFTFEWLPFVMPVLASPIIFIPLVSIASQVTGQGGSFTQARIMVYLVAFQNGFFWKHFFDQRKREGSG